jgi:hypothetical protein
MIEEKPQPIPVEIVSIVVRLSKDSGEKVKDLIHEIYNGSFNYYCQKVQISQPNFYTVVNGGRKCTLEFLDKLLSGIGYRAVITTIDNSVSPAVGYVELEPRPTMHIVEQINPYMEEPQDDEYMLYEEEDESSISDNTTTD